MKQFEITVYGLTGTIFQTRINPEAYSFKLGGYYNWHCPLEECIEKAEAAMKWLFISRTKNECRKLKLRIKREAKVAAK